MRGAHDRDEGALRAPGGSEDHPFPCPWPRGFLALGAVPGPRGHLQAAVRMPFGVLGCTSLGTAGSSPSRLWKEEGQARPGGCFQNVSLSPREVPGKAHVPWSGCGGPAGCGLPAGSSASSSTSVLQSHQSTVSAERKPGESCRLLLHWRGQRDAETEAEGGRDGRTSRSVSPRGLERRVRVSAAASPRGRPPTASV